MNHNKYICHVTKDEEFHNSGWQGSEHKAISIVATKILDEKEYKVTKL